MCSSIAQCAHSTCTNTARWHSWDVCACRWHSSNMHARSSTLIVHAHCSRHNYDMCVQCAQQCKQNTEVIKGNFIRSKFLISCTTDPDLNSNYNLALIPVEGYSDQIKDTIYGVVGAPGKKSGSQCKLFYKRARILPWTQWNTDQICSDIFCKSCKRGSSTSHAR